MLEFPQDILPSRVKIPTVAVGRSILKDGVNARAYTPYRRVLIESILLSRFPICTLTAVVFLIL